MSDTNESAEETTHQQTLLQEHRHRLAHLLEQQAKFGIFLPPYIARDLEETRRQISDLKATLNTSGIAVHDAPGDKPGTTLAEQRAQVTRLIGIVGLLAIVVLVTTALGGGISGWLRKLDAWGVVPNFSKEQPGETLLVIAPFYVSSGNRDSEAHDKIRRAIETEAEQLNLKQLRIEISPESLRADNRDGAEALGARYNASLVIWGEDTGVEIRVGFLNRRKPSLKASNVVINETQRTQIADPPAYNNFIIHDLPGQLSFLSLFATGILAKDLDITLHSVERAVNLVPNGTRIDGLDEAYFLLGWLYHGYVVDRKNAIIMYSKTIALNPKYIYAYQNRGIAQSQEGEDRKALEDFSSIISLEPNLALGYIYRGMIRTATGDFTGALDDCERAIKLDPKNATAYANRGIARYFQSSSNFDRSNKVDPQNSAIYAKREIPNIMKALEDLDYAIRLRDDAETRNDRGLVRSGIGNKNGALDDYNKAIEFDPDYYLAYYNRAGIISENGDLDHAIEDYSKAISLNPGFFETYPARGKIYYSKGDFDLAIKDYDMAISMRPNNPDVYFSRGLANYKKDNIIGALSDFNKAIELNPELVGAYEGRGIVFFKLREMDNVISDFEQVLKLSSDPKKRQQAENIIQCAKDPHCKLQAP